MTFSLDEFQKLIGILAISIGGIYILGGLIVNLHFSRYGITEYRLLKAKYLAVGLNFIFSVGLVIGLTVIFNLILRVDSLQALRFRLIISLFSLFFGAAVYYSQNFNLRVKRFWVKLFGRKEQAAAFSTWWLIVFGISLYPISLALFFYRLKTNIVVPNDMNLDIILGLLISIVGLAIVTLYFGIELYANPVPVGPDAADLIGTGKMQKVQFVGKSEDIELIKQLGISTETSNRTIELDLLDETDDYYLVISQDEEKAIKIHRELIKGILYRGKRNY